MAVIDELKILVTAEVAKAISDLDKLEKKTDKSGASFKDFAKQVAGYTTGMGLAVSATKAVIGGVINLTKESISLAAGFETAKTSWGVLLGDMDAGTKMFESIQSLAAKTPLSFEAVEMGARTLKQFGITSQDIIPTVKMLGDISMGNADKLKGLAIVFGQIQSTGRLMGQDLLQLINQGFNPLQVISQKTGESMADLKKRMEKGGISAQEVADAFKTATSEGGAFYGMMDKTAETTAGKWSTAQDNFKKVLADLGEKVIPIANRALDGFNKSMEMMGQKAILAEVLAGTKKDYDSIQIAIEAQRDVLEQISDEGIGLIGYEGNRTKAAQATLQRLEKQAEQSEKLGMAQRSARNAASAAATKEEKEARARAKAEADAIQAAKDRDKLDTETWLAANERGRGLIELAKQSGEAWNKAAEGTTEYVNGLSGVQNVGLTPFNDAQQWDDLAAGAFKYAEGLTEANAKIIGITQSMEGQQLIAEYFSSTMTALGESVTNALQGEEDAWNSLGDVAKGIVSSILSALGLEYAAKAAGQLAAYIGSAFTDPTALAASIKYAGASGLAYAGAGAIRAMANGGDFDTTGPTNLLVGESGREHVTVSPASRGGSSGGNITINIAGSIVSERQLNQTIRNAAAVRNR